jgi:putative hydrolase of the HAD superfamily
LLQDTLRWFGLVLRGVPAQALLERIHVVEREMRLIRGGDGAFPEVDCAESYGRVFREVQSHDGLEGTWDDRLLRLIVADFGSRRSPHWPMPDLQETLQNLRRRGIQLGIVSNAQHYRRYVFPALCGQSLAQMGFDEELVLWSCDIGLSKPSQGIFRELLCRLRHKRGIDPHETLFVGNDMLIDIRPAVQCGLRTALLAADRGSLRLHSGDPRLTAVRPDIVLTNLRQLLDVCSPGSN